MFCCVVSVYSHGYDHSARCHQTKINTVINETSISRLTAIREISISRYPVIRATSISRYTVVKEVSISRHTVIKETSISRNVFKLYCCSSVIDLPRPSQHDVGLDRPTTTCTYRYSSSKACGREGGCDLQPGQVIEQF